MLLSGWHIYQGEHLTSLVYLSGSLVTLLLLLIQQNRSKTSYLLVSKLVFAAHTLISLSLILLVDQLSSFLHLSVYLVYPLLAFSLLPFKTALLFVLVFSVLANLLLMLQLEGSFRAAYIIVFWLVTLLTSLHSFTQYTRQELLKKQLNRDPKTQLLNEKQLLVDLHKEQKRAEREATHLGIICLTSEKSFDLGSATEVAGCFAAYEAVYSIAANQLVALVPLACPNELKAREKVLVKQLPKLKLHSLVNSTQTPIQESLHVCISKFKVAQ